MESIYDSLKTIPRSFLAGKGQGNPVYTFLAGPHSASLTETGAPISTALSTIPSVHGKIVS
jgi:hypothetical protein